FNAPTRSDMARPTVFGVWTAMTLGTSTVSVQVGVDALPPHAHATPPAPPAMATATTWAYDHDLSSLDEVLGEFFIFGRAKFIRRLWIGFGGRKWKGLRDFRSDGYAGGCSHNGAQNASEYCAAIDRCHLFAPWFEAVSPEALSLGGTGGQKA